MAKLNVSESIEIDEVVFSPIEVRFSSGSSPERYSSGNWLKSLRKEVCPFFVPRLTMSRPIITEPIIPTVAAVMASVSISS